MERRRVQQVRDAWRSGLAYRQRSRRWRKAIPLRRCAVRSRCPRQCPRQVGGEGVGVKVDEGAEQDTELGCGEDGWSVSKDALEGSGASFPLLLLAGLLRLVLLLFAFPLFPERLGSALLLGFILLSFLLMLLLPLLGLFVCLGFRCWRRDWGGILGQTRGGAGVMNRTVVIGAYGDGGSRTFAVDDDGWLRGGAWRGWFSVGILHDGFNFAELSTHDGSRPLLFRAAVAVLDLDKIGMRCDLPVDMGVDLHLVAG